MRAAWWWIDRWRKSTAYSDMSAEQQGLYRNLLDELWLRDGLLPLSDKALGQISGDHEAWERNRDTILARFVRTEDGYRNETHDEVQRESKRKAENQKRYRERHSNVTDNVTGNGRGHVNGHVPRSPSPVHDDEGTRAILRALDRGGVYDAAVAKRRSLATALSKEGVSPQTIDAVTKATASGSRFKNPRAAATTILKGGAAEIDRFLAAGDPAEQHPQNMPVPFQNSLTGAWCKCPACSKAKNGRR